MKKRLLSLIISGLLSTAIQGVTPNTTDEIATTPAKNAIDIDIDLGLSLKNENSPLFFRGRFGKLWMQERAALSLGLDAVKYSTFGFGGGIEAEWLDIPSGLWAQGKFVSTQNEILVSGLAVGWSLIGVEGLVAPFNTNKAAILAKIRLPIGLLTQ